MVDLLMRRGVFPNSSASPAYITFSSPSAFTLSIIGSVKLWDGIVEYSTDGKNWSEWSGLTTLASGVKGGESVLFVRGEGNTILTGPSVQTNYGAWHFSGSDISVSGIIHNMLDYHGNLTVGDYAFKSWFGWKSPGDTALISAENLIIPDPVTVHMCDAMFSRCKGLQRPPRFVAEVLADNCFQSVFYQCSGLNTLPTLRVLTLKPSCYLSMFIDCTSIKISQTKTGEYQNEYRIPISGTGVNASDAITAIFQGTGGTYAPTSTTPINTTFYTSNDVAP